MLMCVGGIIHNHPKFMVQQNGCGICLKQVSIELNLNSFVIVPIQKPSMSKSVMVSLAVETIMIFLGVHVKATEQFLTPTHGGASHFRFSASRSMLVRNPSKL